MAETTRTPTGAAFVKQAMEAKRTAPDERDQEVIYTGWPGLGQGIDRRPRVAPEVRRAEDERKDP